MMACRENNLKRSGCGCIKLICFSIQQKLSQDCKSTILKKKEKRNQVKSYTKWATPGAHSLITHSHRGSVSWFPRKRSSFRVPWAPSCGQERPWPCRLQPQPSIITAHVLAPAPTFHPGPGRCNVMEEITILMKKHRALP